MASTNIPQHLAHPDHGTAHQNCLDKQQRQKRIAQPEQHGSQRRMVPQQRQINEKLADGERHNQEQQGLVSTRERPNKVEFALNTEHAAQSNSQERHR
jgi:hypothetical protein